MARRYIIRADEFDPFGIPEADQIEESKKKYWMTHVLKGDRNRFIEVMVHTKERIALNTDGGQRKYHWRVENVASGFYELSGASVLPKTVDIRNGDKDLESRMFDYVVSVTKNLL